MSLNLNSVSIMLNTNPIPNPNPNRNPKPYTVNITEFYVFFQQMSIYIGAIAFYMDRSAYAYMFSVSVRFDVRIAYAVVLTRRKNSRFDLSSQNVFSG